MSEQHELMLFGESFKRQIQDAFIYKEVRRRSRRPGVGIFYAKAVASGALLNSVRVQLTESGMFVDIFEYVDNIIYGTPPGTVVSPQKIKTWLVEKGLESKFNPESISKQIYEHGSSIWQEHRGNNSGIFDGVDIEQELNRLEEKLSRSTLSTVADNIFNELEKLAA